MHIGVQLAQLGGQASPEAVTASARSAEALGFDSVWVIDPLLSPIPMQPPHPHVDESSLFAEQRAALDPLVTLALPRPRPTGSGWGRTSSRPAGTRRRCLLARWRPSTS
jgi:hypothetical protein